jgi:lipopolysaccharide export system protein LptA
MYFFLSSARGTLLQQALTIFSIILLTVSSGLCQDDAPINIEADRMISQEAKNSVVFTGNVDASQGKVTIRTDEMTIYYQPNDPKNMENQSRKVKKMSCIGNVEITQENWLGTGERMDYFSNERKIILHGDAKAWQGKNMVSGTTITYYLDEKRSIVDRAAATGGSKKPTRVRATIIPKSGSNKK